MSTYLPPLVIDVRVEEEGSRGFRIWLPFFLLWPLLFVSSALALIGTLVVDLALLLGGARYHHYTLLVLRSLRPARRGQRHPRPGQQRTAATSTSTSTERTDQR